MSARPPLFSCANLDGVHVEGATTPSYRVRRRCLQRARPPPQLCIEETCRGGDVGRGGVLSDVETKRIIMHHVYRLTGPCMCSDQWETKNFERDKSVHPLQLLKVFSQVKSET